jgi:two-component system chemotaxis response regulator CheB
MSRRYDIIAIGGSSGSMPVLRRIVQGLPGQFTIPVVVVVHRLRNVKSEMVEILAGNHTICEPDDKDPIRDGHIYLAPQNYHLLVEDSRIFSMDYSEPVNYSRPSIDVTFKCVADVYKNRALVILLSGASGDGAAGMRAVLDACGHAIVQDPATCEAAAMPKTAIAMNPEAEIQSPEMILNTLLSI